CPRDAICPRRRAGEAAAADVDGEGAHRRACRRPHQRRGVQHRARRAEGLHRRPHHHRGLTSHDPDLGSPSRAVTQRLTKPTTTATMWVEPPTWYSDSVPPGPSPTITRLATLSPGAKFNVDASGRGWPAGHAVTNPGAVGSVAVTLSTTAVAPDGTPARPLT